MPQETDRRARRTRQTLRRGLIRLLAQKPVEQISVRELTELCDLNRGTFYLHYSSVPQLLEEMEQEVLDEMDQVLADMEPPGVSPMKSALTRAFAFLSERADFCSVMLRQGGNRPFILRVQQVVRARCLPQWMQVAGGSSVQLEYYLSFVLAGSIGIIERWVEGGLRESPAQMAALLEQFVLQGAAGLLPPVRR